MKKILLLILIATAVSCNNDDEIVAEDYSYFLEQQEPQFRAMLNNYNVLYMFGWNTYQMSSGTMFTGGNAADPMRKLQFVLNEENGDNQFIITSPIYDSSSAEAYNNTFGLGPKKLGPDSDSFYIQIRDNHSIYQFCEMSSDYRIEIMKTEEIFQEEPMYDELKVWFKISHLNADGCSANAFELKDALILARFIDYKNF